CGISLGGLTAMWLGINGPGRVRTLTLANTAARIGTTESWSARMTLVREQGMAGVADLAIPLWFTARFRAAAPHTIAVLRHMIESCLATAAVSGQGRVDSPGVMTPEGGVPALGSYKVPKTPWGEPDIQGTFNANDLQGVPMQRAETVGMRYRLTDNEFNQRVAQRDQN